MQQLSAQCVCHLQLELGEGVSWNHDSGELAWVDVHRGRLYAAAVTRAGLGQVEVHDVGGPLTAVFPLPDPASGWLVGHGQGLARVDRTGALREVATLERQRPAHTRVNDGACDADGRLWLGTMEYAGAPDHGCLYRVDLDGCFTAVLAPTTISNGIGWSPDESTMYFVDSGAGTVTAFDYDAGEIRNSRVLVHVDDDDGVPDGMCVDDDGCLWIAIWDAGEVRRHAPDGSLLARVQTPTKRPSCCTFGGPDRDVLYITSARVGLSETELSSQPHAGCLLAVRLDTTGPGAHPYRGPLEISDGT